VPIGDLIAANTADHELALRQEFERCWTDASRRIIDLANGGTSVGLRSDLIELFRSPLTEIGPLDRFQTAGVVARWWDEISFDMQTLETRGIAGVLDGWLTTAAAMQQDRNGSSLADQPLIGALAADLLRQREDAAASLAELDAAIEVVEATSDDEGGENTGVDSETLSHGELKSLKNHRTQLRKRLKKLDADLLDAARRARGALTTGGAEALVLVIFRQHLQSSIEKRLAGHREDLVATYRTWKRKYAVTLRSREEARETAIASVKRHLTELGYE
jgi:type I restriction enzyme M protein